MMEMVWLGLEAGIALFLLLFIVWWTMFAGKKPNPPQHRDDAPSTKEKENNQ
jgi:hypothetical protein